MKKRLAVWTFGGLGTGHFSQGIPAFERLLNSISQKFEVVVYVRIRPTHRLDNGSFKLRSPPPIMSASLLGWMYLVVIFLVDHARARFEVALACWGWPAGWIVTILGKVLQVPTAVYVLGADATGIASIDYGIFHRPFLRRIATWTYRQTDLLLAITNYQKDQLSAFGIHRPVCVVPWGVDPFEYTFKRKCPGDVLHFIHVGHLSLVKDQATLLRAFAIINENLPSNLVIFGTDCLNGEMQRLSQALKVERNVTFRGMVPYAEMPFHYLRADVMLHTSLSEGQSMALTEAAASGVLLAGTRVGLLYDLDGVSGITVDPGDYKTLAEKILALHKDSEGWAGHIENARMWSETHSFQWTIEKLTAEINNLAKRTC